MQRWMTMALTIVLITNAHAQAYINKTKSGAKKTFTNWYVVKEKYHTSTTGTDSSLTFLLRDSTVQNLDIILHFDNAGKCDSEVKMLSCDSCYKKILKNICDNRFYKWKAINGNTWLSGFPYRLTLTASLNTPNALMIQRNDLSWREYNKLRKSAAAE